MVLILSAWNAVPVTDDRAPQFRYAIRLWLLQERACLTYREARTYLREERRESLEDLAEAFSFTTDEVAKVCERAERKVAEAEKARDVFMGYGPIPGKARFDCRVEDRGCDWDDGVVHACKDDRMERDWRKTDFGPGERPATFEEVEEAREAYWTFRWRLYGAVWSALVVDMQRHGGCTRLQARAWCTVCLLGQSEGTWGRFGLPYRRVARIAWEAGRRMEGSGYDPNPALRAWLGANIAHKPQPPEEDPVFGDARPLWREFAHERTACEGVWTPPRDPVYPDRLPPAARTVAVSAAIDAVQRRFSVAYPVAVGAMVRLGRSAELENAGFGEDAGRYARKGGRMDLQSFEFPGWLVPWLDLCSRVRPAFREKKENRRRRESPTAEGFARYFSTFFPATRSPLFSIRR